MRWAQLIFVLIVAVITVAVLWLLVSSAVPRPDSDQPVLPGAGLKIGVSIPPLQSILARVGGSKVTPIVLLAPGASPHTFEPKISEMSRLQGTETVFVIGHGLDDWAQVMVAEGARIIPVDQGIVLRESAEDHAGAAADPHYWLAFENIRQIARNIVSRLKEVDPVHSDYYESNLKNFEQEVSAAKAASQAELSRRKSNRIVTFHDAWEYFAAEMGLEVAATFEPDAGKEPTPQYLAQLQKTVQRYEISTIFSEPQLSSETLTALLGDLEIKVVNLDPLGADLSESFLETMIQNSKIISETLD